MHKTMRNLIITAIALIAGTTGSLAQQQGDNSILFKTSEAALRIELCSETMFRVTKVTGERMPENEQWMVERYQFPKVEHTVSGKTISTPKLDISIMENPWRIEVATKDGRTLYKELAAGYGDSIYNKVEMGCDEHFFGLGERMERMDQRGQRIHLNVELGRGAKPAVGGKDILRANYCPVPFMLSNRGYGLFFHTAVPNDWDMGWTESESYSFSAPGGDNDYYFIYGPQPEEIIHSYQQLTGVAPMMPRAAYGLHIGSYSGGTWHHESKANDTYVKNLIDKLREERIPFDMMWLDSTWRHFAKLGNGGCTFEFQDQFRDPKGMIDHAYENHVAMFGLHIRSLVDDGKYNTLLTKARKKGYTIDDGRTNAIINFFDKRAVEWWWENAAKLVTRLGVKFFKTDVGGALNYADATIAQKAEHNLFPIAYAKAPYELFAQASGQRGFDHTREGWAGIQRYPFIWAGDWGSEWQWFEPVIRAGLNLGLSGVGYWSHCMGGFEQYSPHDTDLYIRWCQMGMFSPVAILFGMDHPRYHAPWTYGDEAKEIFIKYDSLRYALLPYIYTSAWDMYKTSRPIMAPMLYDNIKDMATYSISDQYMFGRDIMVCPVTVKGALSRPVYFPGGEWVDYWTGERISGRQHKSFLTPIDIMPIFIHRGAIIPMQEPMQYIGEKAGTDMTLLIYPSAKSSYLMYEDDGKTTEYQQGVYATTEFVSELKEKEWTLRINAPKGSYKPNAHYFTVMAYLDKKPKEIYVGGRFIDGWTYDEVHRLLKFVAGQGVLDVVVKL